MAAIATATEAAMTGMATRWHVDNAMAMDSVRAMAIDSATATQRRWNVQRRRDGNGRPVIVADIEIEEEEIAHE